MCCFVDLVEEMRRGATPEEASRTAVTRIAKYYPDFSGAIIAVNKHGKYATACNGMTDFPYIVVQNGTAVLETNVCARGTNSGAYVHTKREYLGVIILTLIAGFVVVLLDD